MDLKKVFINSAGRLRSGWRLLIFVLILVVLTLLFGAVTKAVFIVAVRFVPSSGLAHYLENFIFRLIFLLVALLAGFICTRFLEGLPWRALGLWLHARWARDFLFGSVIGIVSLALATAIATAGGGLSFTISPRVMLVKVLQTLVFSGLLFILAALAEEALFRGYPLQTLTRAGLVTFGILITSIAFAAVHMENPNFTTGLPILNLLLAGVWLAVAYLRTRSLWFPLGVHWAWNWALGSLFGLPVSGISDLAPHPLLRGTDLGPAWLTGGSYGIEGGLACTITLVVSTIFILRTRLVNATPEMKALTSQENPVQVTEPTPGREHL
ncbi:MAG TPA: type II CAAX endopeptidase family protein [Pyrinomonadaceae bacterium]|nr:type II CAAX endopeptidase family protein [Pyrinomonadaceae bacterium]